MWAGTACAFVRAPACAPVRPCARARLCACASLRLRCTSVHQCARSSVSLVLCVSVRLCGSFEACECWAAESVRPVPSDLQLNWESETMVQCPPAFSTSAPGSATPFSARRAWLSLCLEICALRAGRPKPFCKAPPMLGDQVSPMLPHKYTSQVSAKAR